MSMERKVKFPSPQYISEASQQNNILGFSSTEEAGDLF